MKNRHHLLQHITTGLLVWAVLFAIGNFNVAQAGVSSTVVRETTEFLSKQFGKEVAETGAEVVSRRLVILAEKYGDDAIKAARRLGPQALKLADEAGELAGPALRFMSRYGDDALRFVRNPQALKLAASVGDDAAEAMIKHGPDMTQKLLTSYGAEGAKALAKLSRNEAIELASKHADNALAALPDAPKLLQVIGKYGDPAMQFANKHWKVLLGAAAFTAFVSNPEPYLDGTKDLVDVVADNTIGKVTDAVAAGTNWTLWMSLALLGLVVVVLFRQYLQHRLQSRLIK